MNTAPHYDFEGVARAALAQSRDLLQRWFPAGKFRGREFVVGDLSGRPGESLSINTETGRWGDFSTEDKGGDLISLFAAMHRIKQIDAAKQLSDILGGVVDATRAPASAHVTPIRTPESPEWDGIFPVPDNAPPPPAKHHMHGQPAHIARYCDMAGRLLAFVYRCEPPGADKQVLPLTYCRNTRTGQLAWRWQSLPKPRSLYRAEALRKLADANILLVEGEPKCDAANEVLPENWLAMAWPNGAKSWKNCDWSLLARRNVVIWPDADETGMDAARQIAEQLPHHGATARILTPPAGAPDGWDIADAIRESWDQQRLMDFIEPPEPAPPASETALWHSDDAWIEKEIPRRDWICKGYLLRGAVTLIAGPGSAGKSSLAKAWAVAGVLCRPYSRFHPVKPLKVLSYNVEDDLHEERRRISATLRQFGQSAVDLGGNLRILGPHNIGTLLDRDAITGKVRLTDAMVELIAHIEQFAPDVVFLDPLVELHTSDENDNTGLRAVIAQLRALAVRHGIAVVLLHHVRKGSMEPGDPDAVRGAGAIVGAARIVFTVCTMTEEEAKSYSIGKEARKYYFRLDGAKMNYTPLQEPEWFERQAYQLDNGEDVAAAVPWLPPVDVITTTEIDTIKAAVCAGVNGDAYTLRNGTPRSLSVLCKQSGITTEAGIRRVADALKLDGFTEQPYHRPNRVAAKGLRSRDGKPETVQWD